MKINLNEYVNGLRLEDGNVCRCCGGYVIGDCVSVDGLTGYAEDGKKAFFHNECFYPKCYHSRSRKENIDGIRYNVTEDRLGEISCEVEVVSENDDFEFDIINDEAFAKVYVTLLGFGSKCNGGRFQQSTEDGSVTTETPCRGKTLKGMSKWLYARTEEELDTLRDDRCGCHIHVTSNHTCAEAREVYMEVLKRIQALGENGRYEYFGSDFRGYAGNNVSTGWHDSAINVCPSTGCTIEFRLAKVRTPEQYIQCCKWWRATVNTVNRGWDKVQRGIWTPEHLGRKAAKQIDRLLSGAFRKGE